MTILYILQKEFYVANLFKTSRYVECRQFQCINAWIFMISQVTQTHVQNTYLDAKKVRIKYLGMYLHCKIKYLCSNTFFKSKLDTYIFSFPITTQVVEHSTGIRSPDQTTTTLYYKISWIHRAASLLRAAKEVGKLNDRLVREEVCGFPTGNSCSHNVVVCTKVCSIWKKKPTHSFTQVTKSNRLQS